MAKSPTSFGVLAQIPVAGGERSCTARSNRAYLASNFGRILHDQEHWPGKIPTLANFARDRVYFAAVQERGDLYEVVYSESFLVEGGFTRSCWLAKSPTSSKALANRFLSSGLEDLVEVPPL